MASSLTFLVIVTGLTGKGMLSGNAPRALQSHLLRHFSLSTNSRVIVFTTIETSPGGYPHYAPDLIDSALRLLRVLHVERQQEQPADKDENFHGSDVASTQSTTHPRLVFLAHDIGGFIVKKALLLANSERSFEWIAIGTVAALFFGTPHCVPDSTHWGSLLVKTLAESESTLDLLSFLTNFPQYAAHLGGDFEVLSGGYHIINFLASDQRRSPVVTQEHLLNPIYGCDTHVILDCEPEEMWDVGEEQPWTESIRQVVHSHLNLDTKDIQESGRLLLLSLARLHPELHQIGTLAYVSASANVAPSITNIRCDERINNLGDGVCHVVGCQGAGKSIFLSNIASNLRGANRLVLSYSVHQEQNRRVSTADLFRSFCQQALLSPSALYSTTRVCSWLMEGALFTNDAFKGLLCSILSSYTGDIVVCIVDGIDSYDSNTQTKLLADLQQVKNASQSTLGIILTRSAEGDQQQHAEPGSVIDVDKMTTENSELKRLAEAHFKSLAAAKPVWGTISSDAIEKLWMGASTIFELTQKLAFLDDITPSTSQQAENEIQAVPDTFPRFFSYIERLHKFVDDPSIVWVAHATRPLTISELAVCVALNGIDFSEEITMDHLKEKIPWDLHEHLKKRLGLIVRVTGEKVHIHHRLNEEQIRLAAFSAKNNGHLRVLTQCINYLRAASVAWDISREFDRENRLVEYAALHWADHYRQAVETESGTSQETDKEEAIRSVISLLQEERYFGGWLGMFSYYAKVVPGRDRRLPKTRVQVASSFGLTTVLEMLLVNREGTSELSGELEVALDLAVDHGHVEIIRLLVARGVRSEMALVRAARTGNITAMTELLKTHKEYINSWAGPDGVYTPLLQAARCGHLDCFALLGREGAQISTTTPITNLSALHLAARIGQREIVQTLLEAGIPSTVTDEREYTALAYAAEGGFVDIVEKLLEANEVPESVEVGQNQLVNKQTKALDAPLHLAASNGHRKSVQVLLKNGANARLTNKRGYIPLHCAAEGGFKGILEDLLGVTANSDSEPGVGLSDQPTDYDGKVPSPLELAAKSGHCGALVTLREWKDHGSKEALSSALTVACRTSNADCISYLLQWYEEDYSDDQPLRNEEGATVFHLLASRLDAQLFKSVLREMDGRKPTALEAAITFYNKEGRTPLHETVILGRLSILQELSERWLSSFEEATRDDSHKTLLQLAAEAGHDNIVNWLLDNQFHLHDGKGPPAVESQPVMLAARNDHQSTVKLLLSKNHAKVSGQLLHLLLVKDWDDVVELALGKGASVLNWQDPDSNNRTALHIAVEKGKVHIIKALLKANADVNKLNESRKSPFAVAMEASNLDNHLEVVEALLDGDPHNKMEVDTPDDDGVTPLLRACTQCQEGVGNVKVIRRLLEKRKQFVDLNVKYSDESDTELAGKTPLHFAAQILDEDNWESDELLNLLLEHKADINVKHARGSTALFAAAEQGHLKAVETLIDHGADPKVTNNGGSTPLHRASQSGHTECIKVLVERGADINAMKKANEDGGWGVTPLVLAAGQGEGAAVKTLLDHDATLGRALHFAGDLDIAKALLEKFGNAIVLKKDRVLGTPLHSAVMYEDKDLVDLLLTIDNIEINATDGAGRTPLVIAAQRDYESLVETLLAKDADTNKRDYEGKTPLDHAIVEQNSEITVSLCNRTALQLDGCAGVRNHSPLYWAARMPGTHIFEVLNTACEKLDPMQYTQLSELALLAAIASGEDSRFNQLLDVQGVTAMSKDDDGWTPSYYVRCYDRSEMQEKLRQRLALHGYDDETAAEAGREMDSSTKERPVKEPTAWHHNDRHPSLFLRPEEYQNCREMVSVVETLQGTGIGGEDGTAVARADHCLPGDQDYYFEVTIKKGYKNGSQNMGIGLSEDAAALDQMLGFGQGPSWGYHADDGSTYSTEPPSGNLYSKGRAYGEGDTVGCGFDAKNNRVYFTKEGKRLEEDFDSVHGKLYPAVFFSTRQRGVCISANFPKNGTGNFKYRWSRDESKMHAPGDVVMGGIEATDEGTVQLGILSSMLSGG